jgi:MFS transporter, NNP family, nitrate/nitrite transporter
MHRKPSMPPPPALSWFAAFFAWFSFAPLMPEVKKSLGLTTDQVYNANIAAVSATLVARLVVGPLTDSLGARKTFALLLAAGSLPVFCSGLVSSAATLAVVRFFIGVLGACFVCNQVSDEWSLKAGKKLSRFIHLSSYT